jgi:hypothetical protein
MRNFAIVSGFSPCAFGRLQLLFKEDRRLLVQLQNPPAQPALRRLFRRGELPFRQRDPALLRDDLHRFGEADLVDLLHELEDISRNPAAKAVIELARHVDGKRRRLLAMKRAQPLVVLRAAFLQRDVLADDADDVRLLLHALGKIRHPYWCSSKNAKVSPVVTPIPAGGELHVCGKPGYPAATLLRIESSPNLPRQCINNNFSRVVRQ